MLISSGLKEVREVNTDVLDTAPSGIAWVLGNAPTESYTRKSFVPLGNMYRKYGLKPKSIV